MSDYVFTSEGVERTGTFNPLPQGDYPAVITATEWKSPKDNPTGTKYLQLSIEVIDGEYKGRKLTDRLNLNHANDMTRKIAKGTLASILDAVGLVAINNTAEICNKPMMVFVKIKPAQGQYGESNEVKGYKSMVKVATPAIAPVQATAPATAKKPWE
jgi:hypothetical protein